MKQETYIAELTVANVILSFFGIYVCRDVGDGFGWEYANYWQCCTN